MVKVARRGVTDAVMAVLELTGTRSAIVFVGVRPKQMPKLRVKATRIPTTGRTVELRVTVGPLAYAEREKCKQWLRADITPIRLWRRMGYKGK